MREPTPVPELNEILAEREGGLRELLGDELVGFYLPGYPDHRAGLWRDAEQALVPRSRQPHSRALRPLQLPRRQENPPGARRCRHLAGPAEYQETLCFVGQVIRFYEQYELREDPTAS